MKYFLLKFATFGLLVLALNTNAQESWKYLGQEHPGKTASVFGQNTVSNGKVHGRLVVSPDGTEIFWTVVDFSESFPVQIKYVTYNGVSWAEVSNPAFAQQGLNQHPVFSPDGNRIYFQFAENLASDWQMYYVEKTNDGWSDKITDTQNFPSHASFTNTGKVVYKSEMENVHKNIGIYSAEYSNGTMSNESAFGSNINSEYWDYTPYIAPDGSYLLFASTRPTINEEFYIYLSKNNGEGTWGTPEKIHNTVDFAGNARFPSISPDGNFLFFCGDDGNVYWSAITVFDALLPSSIAEINKVEFQVFPNPVHEYIHLKFSQRKTEMRFRLSDLNGRAVLSGDLKDNIIDISSLKSGKYILSITSDGLNLFQQLLVL